MKYKVGDKVRIKNKEWYEDNCNRYGILECGDYEFFEPMNEYCGEVVTITRVDDCYRVNIDKGAFCWTDEMIEGLVEEPVLSAPNITEGVFIHEKDMKCTAEYILPDGYIFKDENGNIINATKIVLEKKKKEYPKTYEECCEVLEIEGNSLLINTTHITDYERDLGNLMGQLHRLIICRNAYWKIAGEEMGLGKPWEPSGNEDCFVISRSCGEVFLYEGLGDSEPFEFPTPEMRNAFKENFDPDIEICKELL